MWFNIINIENETSLNELKLLSEDLIESIYHTLAIFNLVTKQNQDSADMSSYLSCNWNMKIISQHNQCAFDTAEFIVN